MLNFSRAPEFWKTQSYKTIKVLNLIGWFLYWKQFEEKFVGHVLLNTQFELLYYDTLYETNKACIVRGLYIATDRQVSSSNQSCEIALYPYRVACRRGGVSFANWSWSGEPSAQQQNPPSVILTPWSKIAASWAPRYWILSVFCKTALIS